MAYQPGYPLVPGTMIVYPGDEPSSSASSAVLLESIPGFFCPRSHVGAGGHHPPTADGHTRGNYSWRIVQIDGEEIGAKKSAKIN